MDADINAVIAGIVIDIRLSSSLTNLYITASCRSVTAVIGTGIKIITGNGCVHTTLDRITGIRSTGIGIVTIGG